MNELKARGLDDVLIVVTDGSKGFPEAIEAALPNAFVQTCIVHLIRHSLGFMPRKDRKVVMPELRAIYPAQEADARLEALKAIGAGRWRAKGTPPAREAGVRTGIA